MDTHRPRIKGFHSSCPFFRTVLLRKNKTQRLRTLAKDSCQSITTRTGFWMCVLVDIQTADSETLHNTLSQRRYKIKKAINLESLKPKGCSV